ncbi:hypothetical protein QFC20_007412 [Naganishia adeliensis]|uniref:Uncharacterized protein n=1 Tax=Naganishia adeliensis TaxID=92952 RepID=A0ACC2UZB8_9TREE|nr:hypothetical protein QFC20_007412 [Naganishia adeliensis]
MDLDPAELVFRADDNESEIRSLRQQQKALRTKAHEKDCIIREQLAQIKALRSMHETQTQMTERAIQDTVATTQHAHGQAQHMLELEKENDRFEVEVNDLKERNAAWSTRFMDEILSTKALDQEKEIQLDDALTALLDRDRELAGAEVTLRSQAREIRELTRELQSLREAEQLHQDAMMIAEGSMVNVAVRAQELEVQAISGRKQVECLRKIVVETKGELKSMEWHMETVHADHAAERKKWAKPSLMVQLEQLRSKRSIAKTDEQPCENPKRKSARVVLGAIDHNLATVESDAEEVAETLFN